MLFSFCLFVCLFFITYACICTCREHKELLPKGTSRDLYYENERRQIVQAMCKLKKRYSLRKRLFKCCAHEVGAFLFLVS